jgi:hypothetical protein
MAVHVKSLDQPDATEEYGEQGDAQGVMVAGNIVWRSVLKPGWSWERNAQPKTGLEFCPNSHREYVVAGRIRYRNQDGSVVEAGAGDFLVIEPGHAAEVLGDQACVLIDW